MKKLFTVLTVLFVTAMSVFALEDTIQLKVKINDKPAVYTMTGSKDNAAYTTDTLSYADDALYSSEGITAYVKIGRSQTSYATQKTASLTISFGSLSNTVCTVTPTVTKQSGDPNPTISGTNVTVSETFNAKTNYASKPNWLVLKASYAPGSSYTSLSAGLYTADITLTYTVQ